LIYDNLIVRGISTILFTAMLALCAERPAVSQPLVSADDWTGIWRGTYVCGQGVTGLFLTVMRSGTSDVAAVFAFFAVPENPGVPKGEFDMMGRPGPQGNHLHLSPRAWITSPPRYLMVALDGHYDEASGEYSGSVYGPACTRFILRRDLIG
jgi:hypothetical protein